MVANKKGLRNYEVKDGIEAGVVLTGAEVKSIRDNRVNLGNAYVKVIGGELWLVNADIAKYQFSSDEKYDPARSRKLLVRKGQLLNLQSKSKQGGLTIIPMKMYFNRGKVKVLIGLGRGRKGYEKKLKEKERDLNREFHREKRESMI